MIASLVLFGVLGTASLRTRHDGARAVGLDSTPMLTDAGALYLALADADATASNAFLHGGIEPPEQRQRYLDDLASASNRLTSLAERMGAKSDSNDAVTSIARVLPNYTGLVELARANNRQGFPVGAAYLANASALMHSSLLPLATRLYLDSGDQVKDDHRQGVSPIALTGFTIALGAALVVLIVAQVFVFRRTNRVVNPFLLAASLVVVAAGAFGVQRMVSEQRALERAQRDGSDAVEILTAGRLLTLRAASDDSLRLIARGTDNSYETDLDLALGKLGGPDGKSGVLGAAPVGVEHGDAATARPELTKLFLSFRDEVFGVGADQKSGDYAAAVTESLNGEHAAAAALDAGLRDQIVLSQRRLDAAASDARRSFGFLLFAVPIAAAIAGALGLFGLHLRLKEYR